MMHLVKVADQMTAEELDVTVDVDCYTWLVQLATIQPLPVEVPFYDRSARRVDEMMAERRESTSRQRVVVFPVEEGQCWTSFQVLAGRNDPMFIVTMRSSSSVKLASDLGFLARQALHTGCRRLRLHIGSFHVILD